MSAYDEPMNKFAHTTKPPYYAVIFSTQLSEEDPVGYAKIADRMATLAAKQPGYLGIETLRGDDGFGMTASYWESLESISNWRKNAEHKIAQESGKTKWYEKYKIRICLVEREYDFKLS